MAPMTPMYEAAIREVEAFELALASCAALIPKPIDELRAEVVELTTSTTLTWREALRRLAPT